MNKFKFTAWFEVNQTFGFSDISFLVGEPELNIWLCVCDVCVMSVCVCGVPWMDAMLQSVREER